MKNAILKLLFIFCLLVAGKQLTLIYLYGIYAVKELLQKCLFSTTYACWSTLKRWFWLSFAYPIIKVNTCRKQWARISREILNHSKAMKWNHGSWCCCYYVFLACCILFNLVAGLYGPKNYAGPRSLGKCWKANSIFSPPSMAIPITINPLPLIGS